jgi:hypothetical protein
VHKSDSYVVVLFVILFLAIPRVARADACANVGEVFCGTGPASEHVEHPGYYCEYSAINEITEDWEGVRTIDKLWQEGDRNCGTEQATATFSASRTKTNTNRANISASFSSSVSATAGVDLAGLARAEATATASWTAGAGWGNEITDEETIEATDGFTYDGCQECSYEKYYWTGVVGGTADLHTFWSDNEVCTVDGNEYVHWGKKDYDSAITASGRGWEYCTDDHMYDTGRGFIPWDCHCDCPTHTDCYELGGCDGGC